MQQITKEELGEEIKKGARRNKLALRRVEQQIEAHEAMRKDLERGIATAQREYLLFSMALRINEAGNKK